MDLRPGANPAEDRHCTQTLQAFSRLSRKPQPGGTVAPASYRSVRALRPSPSKINPAVMRMRAAPGKNDIHHCPETMKGLPSLIMTLHTGKPPAQKACRTVLTFPCSGEGEQRGYTVREIASMTRLWPHRYRETALSIFVLIQTYLSEIVVVACAYSHPPQTLFPLFYQTLKVLHASQSSPWHVLCKGAVARTGMDPGARRGYVQTHYGRHK
jgi:hypothetical protein